MKKAAKTMSLFDLSVLFATEEQAVAWFEKYRWGDTPTCPHCNQSDRVAKNSQGKFYYRCAGCRKRFTVKIGTLMEASNIEVRKWLYGMYLMVTSRKGISSLQLSKELGITQKSAWFMQHRIRQLCENDSDKLVDVVEIDETYIGGKEKNKHAHKRTKGTQGRSTKTKTAVVGIKQRDGRVVAKSFDKVNSNTMQNYIDDNVEKGSTLCTDEARFYQGVTGYEKLMVNHSVSEYVNGMASTNGIESVWAVLKRGYNGTFHHFSKKHIDRYIN